MRIARLLLLSSIWDLLLPELCVAWTPVSVRRSSQRTSLFASPSDEFSIRAGAEGYSVLRQPLSRSNWDPSVDPNFEVPVSLNDDAQSQQQDEDWWWSNRQQPAANKNSKTRAVENKQEVEGELDLFQRSLDTLDFPRVLRALQEECTTEPAKRIVENAKRAEAQTKLPHPDNTDRAYQPLLADSVEGAQERYRAVQELQSILDDNSGEWRIVVYRNERGYKESVSGRPPPLGGQSLNLMNVLAVTDQGRVLEAEELIEISSMLKVFQNLRSWGLALREVPDQRFVELPKLMESIQVNETLQNLLLNALDQEGRLSGTTFATVGRLRSRVRAIRSDILGALDRLVALPSIQSKLALESGGAIYSEISGGRLVIPVQPSAASSLGIVHDTSRSGKTVYVEPTEIVGQTNDLRQAEGELRAEEARVWRSLTEQILINRQELETSAWAAGQVDLVLARIQLGRRLNGVVPLVQDEGVIRLRDAKHPVLVLRNLDVVGSDVDLGANGNQGLVLTGPNAGGKTVILKLLGLVAIMVRGGIPVPVERAQLNREDSILYQPRVDFFNPVLADIGDLQSVGGDLSTFSGHMLVCREILGNAGSNALVLMDEVGSGTDPNQGVALAQAMLEALVDTGARVAITTHFMQLKQLAAADDRFAVAGMQFVAGRPTYRLLPGNVGESFALAVAERLQLPKSVLDRAMELLDSETRQMGDLIRELEDQKARVDVQVLELEEKKMEITKLEIKMKEEMIRLEKNQLVARRDEAKKFARTLEEREEALQGILEKLKSDPSRRVIAKSWDDIKVIKRDILNEAENIPSVIARKKLVADQMEQVRNELVPVSEIEQVDLRPGDLVTICKSGPLLGREASIVKAIGNRVEVKVNNMNVGLKLSEIAIPTTDTSTRYYGSSQSSSLSKAAERAMAGERRDSGSTVKSTASAADRASSSNSLTMRTLTNTVDVRGCNLEEAKEKIRSKFSSGLMRGMSVVYILHGYGTGGVLRNKVRRWLASEGQVVKNWAPADVSDGGDAFTRVELRK